MVFHLKHLSWYFNEAIKNLCKTKGQNWDKTMPRNLPIRNLDRVRILPEKLEKNYKQDTSHFLFFLHLTYSHPIYFALLFYKPIFLSLKKNYIKVN